MKDGYRQAVHSAVGSPCFSFDSSPEGQLLRALSTGDIALWLAITDAMALSNVVIEH